MSVTVTSAGRRRVDCVHSGGVIEALRRIFPCHRVTTAPRDLATWGRDWTRNYRVAPAAVVFPETVDEVATVTRLANRAGFKLVPSGGRTGLSGGAVASAGEVVVSFDRMNRIVDFNAADRLARCQAGVVTGNLQTFAEQRGLRYPVDFASSGSSQIGGNAATNAGGIRVIRYGMTREWIAGLTVVTGAGDVLELNRGLVKNATGYDLRHLFIGSEGTLGFIVEVETRLAVPPPPSQVMLLGLRNLGDALAALPRLRAALAISAFEFFSDLALAQVVAHAGARSPLSGSHPFYALVEFDADGERAAVRAFEGLIDDGVAADGVLSQSQKQARALWALRERITESIAPLTPYKHDLSVRVSAAPAFLDAVDRLIAERYPTFKACSFGHIGDGNLHLNILRPADMAEETFRRHCEAISPAVFELVRDHGGSVSAEHGVGLLKRDFLGYSRSPAEIAIMRAVKRVLDPNGVMNPGKLLPP